MNFSKRFVVAQYFGREHFAIGWANEIYGYLHADVTAREEMKPDNCP